MICFSFLRCSGVPTPSLSGMANISTYSLAFCILSQCSSLNELFYYVSWVEMVLGFVIICSFPQWIEDRRLFPLFNDDQATEMNWLADIWMGKITLYILMYSPKHCLNLDVNMAWCQYVKIITMISSFPGK